MKKKTRLWRRLSNFEFFLSNRWFLRDLEWNQCDPLRYYGTDMYCREHDGPPPTLWQRAVRRGRRRLYIWFGWDRMLISKQRLAWLKFAKSAVEKKYREQMHGVKEDHGHQS